MGPAVSVTVSGLSRLWGDDLAAVVDLAPIAEDAGIDQIVLPEHVVMGPRTDRYPYGDFPYPVTEPWLEVFTTMAAMAAVTTTIRVGTGVMIGPLRPPAVLAKEAATLDVLSRGRFDLGVGLGWQREEFEASGVPFKGRASRLDDTIRACRALWSGEPTTFESSTVGFTDVVCRPTPVQEGGVPIWFAGPSRPSTAARVAELGAGWLPMAGVPDEELDAGIALVQLAWSDAGRGPGGPGVRAGARPVTDDNGSIDVERTAETLLALGDRGVTVASFGLGRQVRELADLPGYLSALGAARARARS